MKKQRLGEALLIAVGLCAVAVYMLDNWLAIAGFALLTAVLALATRR